MKPARTEHTNITFRRAGREDLPAAVMQFYHGSQEIEICWELTPEEIAQICQTGRIYMVAEGREIPPVQLEVESRW